MYSLLCIVGLYRTTIILHIQCITCHVFTLGGYALTCILMGVCTKWWVLLWC